MNLAGKLNQTCVHWPPGALSGSGNVTYTTPGAEVSCRVEALAALEKRAGRDDKVSETKAFFLSTAGIVKDGYFYDGELAELTSPQIANPQLVADAYIIREVKKVPNINAAQTLVSVRMERGQ